MFSPELAADLANVLAAPPLDEAYDQVKAVMVCRTSDSESSRLGQLLTTEEFEERR